MDILTLFACCSTLTTSTSLRQLAIIAQAILTMTGRVTMLGISRWTEKGGSYRPVPRFFATHLPREQIKVKFFETHLFNPDHEYIVAGDETVIGKSGSQTFGINRFFSGLRGKVICGLGFLDLYLSFLMFNVSAKLLAEKDESCVGINDLKSQYRAAKDARWIIKKVLKITEPIKINELLEDVCGLGSIHQAKAVTSSA